jgi:hypothetical protein
MDNHPHPHAGATYELVRQADGSFGVKVMVLNTHPTIVTGLATEAAAQAWIKRHMQRVASGDNPLKRRTFSSKR